MNTKQSDRRQVVIDVARRRGAIRARDLDKAGIPRTYLRRLTDEGVLERVSWGMYRLRDYPTTENATLVEVARRVPDGVICLLSALLFHEIGTQLPDRIWMAIDRKAWKPRIDEIPTRFVRFSGKALTEGVQRHRSEGVTLKVFSTAKTVADCFKYRNKIGLDVAIEALQDCRQRRKCSADDLWRFAEICRVQRVMRPYLEAIG